MAARIEALIAAASGTGPWRLQSGANRSNGALQFSPQALGGRAEPICLGLGESAVQRGAERREESSQQRKPDGVHGKMQQRTKCSQAEQADIQRMDPMQQSVLLDGDLMMIVRLRLENARSPKRIFRQ